MEPGSENAIDDERTPPFGIAPLVDDLPDTGANVMVIGFGLLLGFDLVIVIALVVGTGGVWWHGPLIGLSMLVLPAVAIWLMMRILWRPWVRRFPAQPVRSDEAVTRGMQSFAFSWFARFNNCLVIAADSEHLHIQLMRPFRWLARGRVSVPWRLVEDVQPARWPGLSRALIAGRRVSGPTWCLSVGGEGPQRRSRR